MLAQLPALRTVHLGRVVFLPETAIATFLILLWLSKAPFEKLHLVDAYQESIWGQRIRLSSVVEAVRSANVASASCLSQENLVEFTQETVICKLFPLNYQ